MKLPLAIIDGILYDREFEPVSAEYAEMTLGEDRVIPETSGLLKLNLNPGRLCAPDGAPVNAGLLREFDRVMEETEKRNIPLVPVLMPGGGPETAEEELNTFQSYCRRGMLIWSEHSTECQERYLGELFCRRGVTGRLPGSYRNLAAIQFYGPLSGVLRNVADYFDGCASPYTASFEAHRARQYYERQDLPENARETAFRHHIFMRSIMALTPMLQHAFGNRVLFVYGETLPENEWSSTLEQVLALNDLPPVLPENKQKKRTAVC